MKIYSIFWSLHPPQDYFDIHNALKIRINNALDCVEDNHEKHLHSVSGSAVDIRYNALLCI